MQERSVMSFFDLATSPSNVRFTHVKINLQRSLQVLCQMARTSAVLYSRWPPRVRPSSWKAQRAEAQFPGNHHLVREVRHSVWLNSSPKTASLGFRACVDRGHVPFSAEGCTFPEVCAVPSSSAVVNTLRQLISACELSPAHAGVRHAIGGRASPAM